MLGFSREHALLTLNPSLYGGSFNLRLPLWIQTIIHKPPKIHPILYILTHFSGRGSLASTALTKDLFPKGDSENTVYVYLPGRPQLALCTKKPF